MLADGEAGSVLLPLWEELRHQVEVVGQLERGPGAGQTLSLGDERVGCPQEAVHDVLFLLGFLGLVPREQC